MKKNSAKVNKASISPAYASAPTFPQTRMRRLRTDEWIRQLTAESTLQTTDLIWPLFIHEEKKDAAVPSMPQVKRLSCDGLLRAAEMALRLRIPAVAVFPVVPTNKKTADGREAWNPRGLIPHAISELKKRFPELGVITDVALDPYTSHGQDGLVDKTGRVLNDKTIDALCKQALVQAAAGVDVVAPSDMMDGRVGALRQALEAAGKHDTKILAYSAKYASAFYGPFRDAAGTAAALGGSDKRTYQMRPTNIREAIAEMRLDLAEGADMLMVKPGMPYLDVIGAAAATFDAPIFAYQVSGEYAMLKAAAAKGWLDENGCKLESLLAFKRAGARGILTYFAPEVAKILLDV